MPRRDYQGTTQQPTPSFWQMVDYAMKQSDLLQMQMGVHIDRRHCTSFDTPQQVRSINIVTSGNNVQA